MFGIEKLAEEISRLRVEVATLRAVVNTMMFRAAANEGMAQTDPLADQINRKFNEGLDAVFSYDGKAKSHGEVRDDG